MKKLLFTSIILFSLSLCFTICAAPAGDAIGQVISVQGTVTAVGTDGATRTLQLQSKIYLNDRVVSTKDAKVQIMLADDSIVSQGELGDMVIDEYMFSPGQKDSANCSMKFIKGVFRVVTGRITELNPKRFKVRTRMATIGIRGCEVLFRLRQTKEDIYILSLPTGKSVVIEKTALPVGLAGNTKLTKKQVLSILRPGVVVSIRENKDLKRRPIKLSEARRIVQESTPEIPRDDPEDTRRRPGDGPRDPNDMGPRPVGEHDPNKPFDPDNPPPFDPDNPPPLDPDNPGAFFDPDNPPLDPDGNPIFFDPDKPPLDADGNPIPFDPDNPPLDPNGNPIPLDPDAPFGPEGEPLIDPDMFFTSPEFTYMPPPGEFFDPDILVKDGIIDDRPADWPDEWPWPPPPDYRPPDWPDGVPWPPPPDDRPPDWPADWPWPPPDGWEPPPPEDQGPPPGSVFRPLGPGFGSAFWEWGVWDDADGQLMGTDVFPVNGTPLLKGGKFLDIVNGTMRYDLRTPPGKGVAVAVFEQQGNPRQLLPVGTCDLTVRIGQSPSLQSEWGGVFNIANQSANNAVHFEVPFTSSEIVDGRLQLKAGQTVMQGSPEFWIRKNGVHYMHSETGGQEVRGELLGPGEPAVPPVNAAIGWFYFVVDNGSDAPFVAKGNFGSDLGPAF